jgi:Peptidase A4 family
MQTLRLSRVRFSAPALTLLLATPLLAGYALGETSHAVSTEFALSTSVAIRPGVETPVVVKAAPNSECILHPLGMTDADHRMRLYADSEGEVHFHVNARQESLEATQMQLDCNSAEGKSTTFPLAVNASASAPKLGSTPQAESLPKEATLRPGLSEADARSFSEEELRQRSYPPRPNPAASPSAYATWLRVVSRPSTRVPAGVVTRPDMSHDHGQVTAGTGSFANWSGYELYGAKGTYDSVVGEWYVPSVTSASGYSYSALWVGLDGIGTSDLIQTGTEQNAFELFPYSFTSYYAFSELLPNQPSESVLTGLPISPGNLMWANVGICDLTGLANPKGTYACFFIENESTNKYADFMVPLGGTSFTGSEAEWIMERPWVGGQISQLANYNEAIMFSAEAQTAAGSNVPYNASNSNNWTMVNDYVTYADNNTLSTVKQENSSEMLFVWHNYH